MIAKEGWFARRKYGGWGFFPKTWQGWVYVGVLVSPLIIISILGINGDAKFIANCIWGVVLVAAIVDIMRSIKKDEREVIHEAIAERNALWAILVVLAVGVGYQAISGVVKNVVEVDPVIIIALIAGVLVKAGSNIYLDKKD